MPKPHIPYPPEYRQRMVAGGPRSEGGQPEAGPDRNQVHAEGVGQKSVGPSKAPAPELLLILEPASGLEPLTC